ncbi:MAG: hypothetical protein HZC55_26830 [Verrucomicrobia bacterium]|nr:hypothetical protein [Verrucomicrobiota bacterium]
MNSVFVLASVIGLLTLAVGAVVTYFAVRSAPEGFEDAEGFHQIVTNDRVATVAPAHAEAAHSGVVSLAA